MPFLRDQIPVSMLKPLKSYTFWDGVALQMT